MTGWRNLMLGFAVWALAFGFALAEAPDEQRVAPPSEGQRVLVMLPLPPAHFRPDSDYSDSYEDQSGRIARLRIAKRLARKHGLAVVDDWPMPVVGVDCVVMAVPAGQSLSDVAKSLSLEPEVKWSEPMRRYHAEGGAAAHEPRLFRAQPATTEWELGRLHNIARGRNVRVAVIDSGVDQSHPDLVGQVQISRDFVSGHGGSAEEHGTGVAGVIAARGVGILGVAPEARLMALRACWQALPSAGQPATTCEALALAKALQFAISHDAHVINLSLSGPPDRLLSELIDAALARRIVVVAAFDRDEPSGGFPASHPGVVAVGDEPLAVPKGVYLAPGRDIPTTQPGGRWYFVNGSSYAAAQVSGLLALAKEKRRGMTAPLTPLYVTGGSVIDACATTMQSRALPECQRPLLISRQ
jgi:subtilisin family serine protease